jgi:hypothetical protein
MQETQSSRTEPQSHTDTGSQWLATFSLDTAKLGLALYLLGVFVSIIYYSRFSILTLDFAKAQAILLGCYVIIFYPSIVMMTLWLLRNVTNSALIAVVFFVVLTVFDLLAELAAGSNGVRLALAAVSMCALQTLCFAETETIFLSLRERRDLLTFRIFPSRRKGAIFVLLFCVHFALTMLPGIPMYLGGAKPLGVQVFTKIEDLPANRFVPYQKDAPQINGSIDSYSLRLLYETDKDMYFFADLKSGTDTLAHSVMRIPRDQITRIDYFTPKWVVWRQ